MLYVILAIVLFTVQFMLSGLDNGIFYAKGSDVGGIVGRAVDNIHFAESLGNIVRSLTIFCIGMALTDSWQHVGYLMRVLANLNMVYATYLVGGVFFQGFINQATRRPFIDPNEKWKQQVGDTKLWIPKFGGFGYGRIVASIVGVVLLSLYVVMLWTLGL